MSLEDGAIEERNKDGRKKIEERRTVKRGKQMKERNVRQNEKELIDNNKE